MHIQWYPGHMTKAMRMMQASLQKVDCVIYVLDSRAIESSMNPQFDKMIAGKPVLYVFNKCDLVDSQELKLWQNYFQKHDKVGVAVSSIGTRHRGIIVDKLKEINSAVIEKFANKGAKKSVRAMVVGVPNSGKSTLINSLCGNKRAITGNRPGVTRGKQWVTLAEGVELLDTPGSLPPFFEDQEKALHLAFIGSISDDVYSIEELAIEIIKYCKASNLKDFAERYSLADLSLDDHEIMSSIARSRGYIFTKDELDYSRTATAIVDDFRKLKYGKIMLDKAPMATK